MGDESRIPVSWWALLDMMGTLSSQGFYGVSGSVACLLRVHQARSGSALMRLERDARWGKEGSLFLPASYGCLL